MPPIISWAKRHSFSLESHVHSASQVESGPVQNMSHAYQSHTLDLLFPQQYVARTPLSKNLVTWCDICFCRWHAEVESSQLIMLFCNRFMSEGCSWHVARQWVTALLQFLWRLWLSCCSLWVLQTVEQMMPKRQCFVSQSTGCCKIVVMIPPLQVVS